VSGSSATTKKLRKNETVSRAKVKSDAKNGETSRTEEEEAHASQTKRTATKEEDMVEDVVRAVEVQREEIMATDSYHATIYSASDREDTTSTYVEGAGRNRSDSGEGQQHLQGHTVNVEH
jgi:hypothetical protein